MIRIVVDCDGGDRGPRPCVEGALEACRRFNLHVTLVGKERNIRRFLSRKLARKGMESRISVVDATETITMSDSPSESLRKRRSAIAIACKMVKDGEADAIVSPGNTGAVLAHSLLSWRTIPPIKKPAIATLLPTRHDRVVVIDSGAVVDCKPHQLVNFAIMGSTYAREVLGRANPRIGLLSNGEEESKGNELTIQSHQLLKKTGLNFVGNAEGRDIFGGEFDVIVCDGFVGNVVLKTSEGLAKTITELIAREARASIPTTIGGALIYPAIRRVKRRTDYDEAGGAPLMGVNGICIISHGSSNAKAIMNALRVAAEGVIRHLPERVAEDLQTVHSRMEAEGVSHGVVMGDAPPEEAEKKA